MMTDKDLAREIIERRPIICSECGGKLKYTGCGEYQCMDCDKIMYDDFGKVRKFLYENGPTPAPVVVEATGVENHLVIELLREGRIELVENSGFFLQCEKCGCAIRCGRICPDCAQKLANALDQALKESVGEKPKKTAYTAHNLSDSKMHYYNKDSIK